MSWATEEHHNNGQVDCTARIKVSQVDLDWQKKVNYFWLTEAHDASGHQGRDTIQIGSWLRDGLNHGQYFPDYP